MWEALADDAAPTNPEATHAYVAGTPIIDPDTGAVIMAASFDWAEKARLDFLDRLQKRDLDPMNGVIVPVHRVGRRPVAARGQSPLDRWKAKRRAITASAPQNTEP